MGFGADIKSKADKNIGEILAQLQPEDLLKFGLIPEFVGRLPVVATLNALDEAALLRILTEPRNALTKQYQRLFEMDDVELSFEEDALKEIAKKAMERKTGARGLRSIIEESMLDIMFEVPSNPDIEKCTVTKDTILKKANPELVLNPNKKPLRKKGGSKAKGISETAG